jgi:parallel beta-helix repeat protein
LTAGGAGEIGKAEQGGFVAELEANTVDGCAHGVRIGGKVQAVFKNNTIQNNENRGVLIKKQARAMMQGNTITDNGGSSDGADPAYGGVAFETASNKTPEGDLGGGAVEIDGKTLTSTGGNQICNNSHANGSPVDLHVVGPSTISAYSNNSSGVCAGQTMNVLTEDGGQVLQ